MQQNSNASLSKRVGQTWFCHFQKCGEKGTIVLKYQLEKLSKVERTFAENRFFYHWWPLFSWKDFIGLSLKIHPIKFIFTMIIGLTN
jgi:hypothetical protein